MAGDDPSLNNGSGIATTSELVGLADAPRARSSSYDVVDVTAVVAVLAVVIVVCWSEVGSFAIAVSFCFDVVLTFLIVVFVGVDFACTAGVTELSPDAVLRFSDCSNVAVSADDSGVVCSTKYNTARLDDDWKSIPKSPRILSSFSWISIGI